MNGTAETPVVEPEASKAITKKFRRCLQPKKHDDEIAYVEDYIKREESKKYPQKLPATIITAIPVETTTRIIMLEIAPFVIMSI